MESSGLIGRVSMSAKLVDVLPATVAGILKT